jgi:long-subunit acyl-CoA synthetase (AMP-forming)
MALPALFTILPSEVYLAEIEKRKNEVSDQDIATIIYTSGTTGNPKGVMLITRKYHQQYKWSKTGHTA